MTSSFFWRESWNAHTFEFLSTWNFPAPQSKETVLRRTCCKTKSNYVFRVTSPKLSTMWPLDNSPACESGCVSRYRQWSSPVSQRTECSWYLNFSGVDSHTDQLLNQSVGKYVGPCAMVSKEKVYSGPLKSKATDISNETPLWGESLGSAQGCISLSKTMAGVKRLGSVPHPLLHSSSEALPTAGARPGVGAWRGMAKMKIRILALHSSEQ